MTTNEKSEETSKMTEKEKERWKLFAVIASAIGTAITTYFAAKE